MEIRVPQRFIFDTKDAVPISDVIASLVGAEELFQQLAPFLEDIFPGLRIEKVEVSVAEISQASPLKEVLWAALFLTYQNDLERDVPKILADLTGIQIPDHYHSIITVVFCLLLFYGADYLYSHVYKPVFSKKLRAQLDALVKDVSGELKIPEDKIRDILEKRYGGSKGNSVIRSVTRFITPSKNQENANIKIGDLLLGADSISEIPSSAQIEMDKEDQKSTPFINVDIELHAQDIDRTKTGWAAVIPVIGDKRLKMEIFPPIKTEDIYTKPRIKGDVIVVYQKNKQGEFEPRQAHLIRVNNS